MGDSPLASLRCKSRCGLALAARQAWLWSALAWPMARRVTADDLSTEGFGPLCWVLWNPDVARRGVARPGSGESRTVRLGVARQPLQTAALGASAPTAALFGGQIRCEHWSDQVGQVKAMSGQAKAGQAARSFFGGSLLESRCAPAWHGLIRHGCSVQQGLQTAVRRVRPPYCSLGNRFGLARPQRPARVRGEASTARQGAAGLGNTIPAALHYEHLGSRNVLRL
jgi:hypothetical protein